MGTAVQDTGIWGGLSSQIAAVVEAVAPGVVTIHGGGRSTASGLVWRPGVIVTVRQGLRRMDSLLVSQQGSPVPATLAGADAGTDLAVLRVDPGIGKAVQTAGAATARVGEMVLAVGRSALGDISASAGIVARLGSEWRTWRGGQIDSLLRPDLQLYVGQSGSGLVNQAGQVLGMNSSALARNAVITVPAATIDRIVDHLLERGHVPRPFLGAAMQAVPVPATARAQFAEAAEAALLVLQVEPQGPAAAAGLLVGDLVHSVNGETMHDVRDVQYRLSQMKVGDLLRMAVLRGGAPVNVTVTLADRG